MTDIMSLRVARAPQRQTVLPHAVVPVVTDRDHRILDNPGANMSEAQLTVLAQAYVRSPSFVNSRTVLPPPTDQLDAWLLNHDNAPSLPDFEQHLIQSAAGAPSATGEAAAQRLVATGDWAETRRRVADSLIAASVVSTVSVEDRTHLVRLILVMGLVEYSAANYTTIASANDPGQFILGLLRDRTPLLPSPPFPLAFKSGLARRPGFADLYTVREEWSCYIPGEIAQIENVLKGERKERIHKETNETETTLVTESAHKELQENDNQTTDRFELSDEASKQTQQKVGVEGHVDVSGQAGPMKIEAYLGGSFDYSQNDATRHASQESHEIVFKAVTRIEDMVRQARTDRTLKRVEDTDTHRLDATNAPEHVVGIYRWVDKMQRLQMFKYPHRYLLEFEVPEPGAYLRWLELRGRDRDFETPEPVPFTVDGKPGSRQLTPSDLDEFDHFAIAGRYHTVDISPYPPETIDVTGWLYKPAEADPAEDKQPIEVWETPVTATPSAAGSPTPAGGVTGESIVVPEGYQAKKINGSLFTWGGRLQPAPAWSIDKDNNYLNPLIVAPPALYLSIGDGPAQLGPLPEAYLAAGSLDPLGNPKSLEDASNPWAVDFERDLEADEGTKKTGILPIRVMASNFDLASVFAWARCVRTYAAIQKWQYETFYKVQAAYFELKQQHEDEKAQRQIRAGIQIDGASPTENAKRAQQELKRLVIELLSGDTFKGAPAIDNEPSEPDADPDQAPLTNIAEAVSVAPTIQFLEQVFEWENMTYVLYPYYWAGNGAWPDLLSISSTDADYADFLKAGSARVVVSARVGYEDQVTAYISTGVVWGGGPAPAPDEEKYISVAQEIRSLKGAPDDGTPLDSWEVKLPTTLVWLDPDPQLPKVNSSNSLTAPKDSRCAASGNGKQPEHDGAQPQRAVRAGSGRRGSPRAINDTRRGAP